MFAANIDANDLVPRPPDGGYGWVIVACVFMCNFVFEGCCFGFGVILPSLEVAYNTQANGLANQCLCRRNTAVQKHKRH
jgi:hypothetical protein